MEVEEVDGSVEGSDDEQVDLEMEFSSSESLDVANSPPRVNFDSKKVKAELDRELAQLAEGQDEFDFKVIGQAHVGLTSQSKQITDAWVANSVRFSAKISGNKDLLPLEQLAGLRSEFTPILESFAKVWFPVQRAVLPGLLNTKKHILPQRDLIICSPTGSGKTLCYVLPILNSVHAVNVASVFALVIAPAANLAQQIFKEFQKFNAVEARVVALCGQGDYENERSALSSRPHIVVATPGRLIEHLLDESELLDISMLRYLVIDEADRMQDTARMEWLELVEKYANVPQSNVMNVASLTNGLTNRWLQRILVSATLSLDVHKLHSWNLRCPQLFRADQHHRSDGKAERSDEPVADIPTAIILPELLSHRLITCKPTLKPLLLYQQLRAHLEDWQRIIVFVNKKETGHRLSLLLSLLGKEKLSVADFSSKLYKDRRCKLLGKFKSGKIRVLIACDILSRGMDLVDIDCVVNYDVPINERIFVHRTGRTARAMKAGTLLSMATKEEKMKLKKMLIANNIWNGVEEMKAEEEFDEKMMRRYEKALENLRKELHENGTDDKC